jgi:multidrug efflux system membrane fusion protein
VVKSDDTVAIQPVDITRIQDGIAVIAKGVASGQRVVLDGQYKLKPGSHIFENKASAASSPAAASAPAATVKGAAK